MSDPRTGTKPATIDELLRQQDDEELIEIDEFGRISRRGDRPPNQTGQKPTVLRDPHGEYSLTRRRDEAAR